MKKINPVEAFLWTFRRNERDVVNLYRSLSDVMRLATGGDMLNFGYWEADTPTPLSAQERLCSRFGRLARLSAGQRVLDVGGGYGAPAAQWRSEHGPMEIFSVDVGFGQLAGSPPDMPRVNATATSLPFEDSSLDRVLAFESAQHFRPLSGFLAESSRVLKDGGLLALAIPVTVVRMSIPLIRLGVLSVTWSSEHYSEGHVLSSVRDAGFRVGSVERIGPSVYVPLADYYGANRETIRKRILGSYPGYVEKILHRSVKRMKRISQNGTIDYLLVLCERRDGGGRSGPPCAGVPRPQTQSLSP